MTKQILTGLESMTCDVVFMAEHDVIYHETNFDFTPEREDLYYYNTNVYKINTEKGYAVRVDDCRQLSGLCAYRDTLLKHYKERVRRIEKEGYSNRIGHEPGTHNRKERIDDLKSERWESLIPILDFRTGQNLTKSRWTKEEFRNQKYVQGWTEVTEIPHWGNVETFMKYLK